MKRPSFFHSLASTLGPHRELLVGLVGSTFVLATDLIYAKGSWWVLLKSAGWAVLAGGLAWTKDYLAKRMAGTPLGRYATPTAAILLRLTGRP